MEEFKKLRAEVQRLQDEKKLPTWPSDEQKIDWAHGNAAIENPDVTRAVVEAALAKLPKTACE